MNMHEGIWVTAVKDPRSVTSALNEDVWSASCHCHFTPIKKTPVPNRQDKDWTIWPIWTLCRRWKSLTLANDCTTIHWSSRPQPSHY